MCCLNLMYVVIFLFKFEQLCGYLLGNSCSLGLRYVLHIFLIIACLYILKMKEQQRNFIVAQYFS